MKKLTKIINKENVINNIKNNLFIFSFIIFSNIILTVFKLFTVGFTVSSTAMDFFVVLLIASFAFLFKKKSRIIYLNISTIIILIICFLHHAYNDYFHNFASISIIETLFELSGVDNVSVNVINFGLLSYIALLIVFILIYRYKIKKRDIFKISKDKFIVTFLISFLGIFTIYFIHPEYHKFLFNQYERTSIVKKVGIVNYQINDIFRSALNLYIQEDDEIVILEEIDEFYENKEKSKSNEYTDIFKGKNVIFVHFESIQNFLIDLEFNNEEVMPNLNELKEKGIYFLNFYSQINYGTSSDTEFTLSTGILPAVNGTVFLDYSDREYLTIQQLLKAEGYDIYSMHGNRASFWSRDAMYPIIGYDKFYSQKDYDIDEVIGMGLSDRSFFNQSLDIIEKDILTKNNPFMITMLTLTNHFPFSSVEKYGEFDVSVTNDNNQTFDYLEGTYIGNYMKSVHYADSALGEFVDNLEEKGVLDDTVLIIYGDHDAKIPIEEYEYMYNYNDNTGELYEENEEGYIEYNDIDYELNKKVPLIIYSKDNNISEEIDTLMGMYDVLPTVGNMFGIHSKYALGSDIMNIDYNMIPFPNGSFITNDIYYNSNDDTFRSLKGKDSNYNEISILKEKVNEYIVISNNIIKYNYMGKNRE